MIDPAFYQQFGPQLAKQGYRPIPILPGTKKPMLEGWPAYQAQPGDFDTYAAASVGVLCGNGLVFADVDVYDEDMARRLHRYLSGHLGVAPLRGGQFPKFAMPYRIDPAASTGKVASRVFINPLQPQQRQRIEFLGTGNYLVTHGVHPNTGLEYQWLDVDIAASPFSKLSEITQDMIREVIAWFEAQALALGWIPVMSSKQLAQAHRPSKQGQRANSPAAVKRVLDAMATIPNDLSYEDWIAVGLACKGALGDTAEGVEAWLDFSLQYPDNTPEMALSKWDTFQPRAIGAGSIIHLAREALRKRQLGMFAPLQAEPQPDDTDPTDSALTTGEFAKSLKGPVYAAPAGEFSRALTRGGYLVRGVVRKGCVYTATSQPSAGKTTVLNYLAACIQGGHPFCGLATRRGQVIYCAADDPYGVLDRLDALALNGFPEAHEVLVSGQPFDATSPEAQELLVKLAGHTPIAAIMLDTSIYYMPPDAEENDNTDVSRFLATVRQLTKLPGNPMIVVLTHPRKGAGNDPEELIPRGGSAALGASDGNIAIWRNDDVVTLHHSAKMRGAFDELHFRIERRVATGLFDEEGLAVHTVMALPLSDDVMQQLESVEGATRGRILAWLQAQPKEQTFPSAVIALKMGLNERTVRRHLLTLVASKDVRAEGKFKSAVYRAAKHR